MKQTITLTFGDNAENHVGMQKIGKDAECGLNLNDLNEIITEFKKLSKNVEHKLFNLNDLLENKDKTNYDAHFLVIKNGVNILSNLNNLMNEQINLEWDNKCKMYGRVVNKKARYNLCYSDFTQEPDYENGKGRVYDFKNLNELKNLRQNLGKLHPKLLNLQCEGNNYYDIDNCYIGYHGDSERKIVVGARLGETFPIHFQWYNKRNTVGKLFTYNLENGDIYFMTEKTSGNDWKKSNIFTLRHAAGKNILAHC